MSQESTGIHWLLSDTNFILSSIIDIEINPHRNKKEKSYHENDRI